MQPEQETTTCSQADLSGKAALPASDLLAGLNHEVRTAMNGIVGMLDMLLESGLPANQRDLASTAQHSAENLLGFIEAVVDLAAMSEGCLHLESRSFELSSVLREAFDAGGTPTPRSARPLPAALVRGDAVRIRQLLAGMLRIAQGIGAIVELETSAAYQQGRCEITIDVTACKCCDGAAHALALIDAAPAGVEVVRSYGKLGLDIELCKRLASLMGGQISTQRSTQASHVLHLVLSLPLAAASLEGKRLLVIEKNEADRQLLQTLFARHGMEVDAFASIGAALERLREKADAFRAAIIGRDESGLDAELLAAAIKGDPQARALRLAALCDSGSGANEAALKQAGFNALLARPIDEAAALTAIASLCGDGKEPDTSKPSSSIPRQDFRGHRVLVADDNAVNLQVARRMLEKLGCHVDVATDGGQAVAMHHATPYELILMDCQMPGMDGREAARRIRALGGAASRVPVVAVTACATSSERECCIAAGMDDFIAKPLRPQVLDAALAKWLQAQVAVSTDTTVAEPQCKDELDEVKEMFGADFGELAALYRNDSPPRIAALHQAAAAGDCAAVAKVAHAFGGSSVSIGASGLGALCKELELHAKTGSLEGFGQRMAAIEVEYERICGRLRSLLDQ